MVRKGGKLIKCKDTKGGKSTQKILKATGINKTRNKIKNREGELKQKCRNKSKKRRHQGKKGNNFQKTAKGIKYGMETELKKRAVLGK